ncbi:MAG: YeeE/YedE thiosulfate transporter family protein [Longimicrobiales bacterium]
MKAPLYDFGAFGDGTALLLALPIGFAFGWFLERGGMGNARKLAGQFYLTDLTVFKVMFSAIVTAALGAFWLSRIGWLDLSRITVPPTYLVPQLLGGLIFGVGFVTGGLCPGTSCVAAASGRADGLALIGGMLSGVLLFGELLPRFERFYGSTSRGPQTLTDVLPLSHGAIVFLIVAIALTCFVVAEAIERRSSIQI